MKKIYLYCKDSKPDGIQVIIKNLRKSLDKYDYELEDINNLKKLKKQDVVIPYGILASFKLLFSRHKCILSLMVDAMSLGLYSETKYYRDKKIYNNKTAFKCYFKAFLFLILEIIVLLFYKRVMLVSPNDKNYFMRFNPLKKYTDNKILIVKNGVDIPVQNRNSLINREKIRIGVLSFWAQSPYNALINFLNEYSYRLLNDFPKLTIVVAGRNLSEDMKIKLSYYPNVEIVGEIESLKDFFSSIHAMLNVLPKECGVLNKLLDSMAYKTPIISLPGSLKAFDCISKSYFFSFENYDQLENSIKLLSDIDRTNMMGEEYYNYILRFHSWENNYKIFAEEILNLF